MAGIVGVLYLVNISGDIKLVRSPPELAEDVASTLVVERVLLHATDCCNSPRINKRVMALFITPHYLFLGQLSKWVGWEIGR